MIEIPEIHIGPVEEIPIDWRSMPEEDDPDDEELAETQPEIVAVLGFDPKGK